MDNDQAKLILQAYRPNGADAADPFFADALEQARLDPALARWLDSQQAFDRKMIEALAPVAPPPQLKEAIILTQRVTPFPRALRMSSSKRTIFALAACMALLLIAGAVLHTVGPLRWQRAPSLAFLTASVLDLKRHDQITLGNMNSDPARLRAWLAERGAPSDFTLPPGLTGVPSLGCQSYRIDGAKVSLICFAYGPKQVVHLFIIKRDAVSNSPESSKPEVHSDGDIAYAAWTQGEMSYILTGDQISADDLHRIIQNT
jgi:hypothetical protein